MPRLTNRDYLTIRHFLVRLWKQDDGHAFAVLPTAAQRDLHGYYVLTQYLQKAEALKHRAAMTKTFSSLPQKAGRAFEALRAHLEGRPNEVGDRHLERSTSLVTTNGKSRELRVLAVARPKLDVDLLARALVQLAKEDVDGKLLKRGLKAKARHERDRG